MNFVYSQEEVFRHQNAWQRDYHAVEVVTLSGTEVRVGNDRSPEAQVLRVHYMLQQDGIANEREAAWKGKVFSLMQMFFNAHINALFNAGLVRLHDGEMAVVKPETLAALHETFIRDPTPHPDSVSIDAVINRAREIAKEHE